MSDTPIVDGAIQEEQLTLSPECVVFAITEKQKLFVDEWVKDKRLTPYQVYAKLFRKGIVDVECKEDTRVWVAHKGVRSYYLHLMSELKKETQVDREYVIYKIKSVIERCSQAERVFDKDGFETGEYKFDARGVLSGAEMLGKYLGMFQNKLEILDNRDVKKPVIDSTMDVKKATEAYRNMLKDPGITSDETIIDV